MLNENAKKWVAALRSGEYEQAEMYLRVNNKFCCLGVACDLFAKEREGEWRDTHNGYTEFRISADDDPEFGVQIGDTELPHSVFRWLGLYNENGKYRKEGVTTWGLIHDNDAAHLNFSQIADIIESEPEGLFVK